MTRQEFEQTWGDHPEQAHFRAWDLWRRPAPRGSAMTYDVLEAWARHVAWAFSYESYYGKVPLPALVLPPTAVVQWALTRQQPKENP